MCFCREREREKSKENRPQTCAPTAYLANLHENIEIFVLMRPHGDSRWRPQHKDCPRRSLHGDSAWRPPHRDSPWRSPHGKAPWMPPHVCIRACVLRASMRAYGTHLMTRTCSCVKRSVTIQIRHLQFVVSFGFVSREPQEGQQQPPRAQRQGL